MKTIKDNSKKLRKLTSRKKKKNKTIKSNSKKQNKITIRGGAHGRRLSLFRRDAHVRDLEDYHPIPAKRGKTRGYFVAFEGYLKYCNSQKEAQNFKDDLIPLHRIDVDNFTVERNKIKLKTKNTNQRYVMKANSSEEALKWKEQLEKMITQNEKDEFAMKLARQEDERAALEEANKAYLIKQDELQKNFQSIKKPEEMENFLLSNDKEDSESEFSLS